MICSITQLLDSITAVPGVIYATEKSINPLSNNKTLVVIQVYIDGELQQEKNHPADLNIVVSDGIGTRDHIR